MKTCQNPSCAMKDARVDTERATCLTCGGPLENPLGGLFGDLLGDLGRATGAPMPDAGRSDMLRALRAADEILTRFAHGVPVKRAEITTVQATIDTVLRKFG